MEKSTQSNHPRIAARTPEEQCYRDGLAHSIKSVKCGLNGIDSYSAETVHQYILNTLGLTKQAIVEIFALPLPFSVYAYSTFNNDMEQFTGLDNEIAMKMINMNYGKFVAKYLKSFSGLDHKEIALALIAKNQSDDLLYHIGSFDPQSLDREVAMQLLEKHTRYSFPDRINYFTLEAGDYKEIAYRLVDMGQSDAVDRNIYKFKGLTAEDIIHLNRSVSNPSKMIYTVDDERFVLLKDTKSIGVNILGWTNSRALYMDHQNNVSYFQVTSDNCKYPCDYCKTAMFTVGRTTGYNFHKEEGYGNYVLYQKLSGVPKDTSLESLREFLQLPIVANKQ